jgi:hypothetical protein
MAYQFQHSVEVGVSQEAAWRFWTNVENWTLDVAIEWVKLDGFFQAGVQGTTKTRGADLVQWEIAEVSEGESAVIEIPMPEAAARFVWKFEELAEERTRLTQQITLSGEQVDMYVAQMGEGFEQGVRQGMEKLSKEMERPAWLKRSVRHFQYVYAI